MKNSKQKRLALEAALKAAEAVSEAGGNKEEQGDAAEIAAGQAFIEVSSGILFVCLFPESYSKTAGLKWGGM